ncbi:MAG: 3-deoxy-D-manno-octulosonic acid transferase [Saprospiraceae bacterium]
MTLFTTFTIMVLIYRFATWVYFTGIRVVSPFDSKARLWAAGRRNLFAKLESDFGKKAKHEGPIVWMHCASLGEFEQGRPVIETLKKRHPGVKILLTFFSPSGYEIRKDYPLADWVYYLPDDTPGNARRFLQLTQPAFAIFVKYEFWHFYLSQLKANGIATLLIAASFRPEQPFFKWYGGLYRRMLQSFTTIFVQDASSKKLCETITSTPVVLAGDPRIDRVLEISNERPPLPLVEKFCGNAPVLVCGSTWPQDEKLIAEAMQNPALCKWKIIIAPHEVHASHLAFLEKTMQGKTIRYSTAQDLPHAELTTARVLLIDGIGMLAHLYRFAKVAFVGGGNHKPGIHNTLEPAAFGVPLIFGRHYRRFPEAEFFARNGGAFVVKNIEDMVSAILQLGNASQYKKSARIMTSFLKLNRGATGTITEKIETLLAARKTKKPTSHTGSQLI